MMFVASSRGVFWLSADLALTRDMSGVWPLAPGQDCVVSSETIELLDLGSERLPRLSLPGRGSGVGGPGLLYETFPALTRLEPRRLARTKELLASLTFSISTRVFHPSLYI